MAVSLKELISWSPVPVVRVEPSQFLSQNMHLFEDDSRCYIQKTLDELIVSACMLWLTDDEQKRMGYPERIILLNNTDPEYQLVYFLFHEVGHALCSIENCPCFYGNPSKTEYHADRFAINVLYTGVSSKWLSLRSLKFAMGDIRAREPSSYYGTACQRLMRLNIWKKAQSLCI